MAGQSVRSIEPADAVLELGIKAATAYGRDDLAARLQGVRDRMGRPEVHVAVVGEFKSGKSSLINAVIGASVCPVDDGLSTTVPTLVRWAAERHATMVLEPEDAGSWNTAPARTTLALPELVDVVTEAGNAGNHRRIRLVEVFVPQPILEAGLVLLDTPGAGGLLSPLATPTLAALSGVDAVVFTTSSAQELTRPEVELLRAVASVCPVVLIGLTKIDLAPEWRRIAELDRGHLADSGLGFPVIGLSAAVRDYALSRGDDEANEESGFLELGRRIRAVVSSVEQLHVRTAGSEVVAAAAQMTTAFEAERMALVDPAEAENLTAQLENAATRAAALRTASAKWLQRLNDGVSDLTAHVNYTLRERLRHVLGVAEQMIDAADPASSYDATVAWMRDQIAAEVMGLYGELTDRVNDLAADVSALFDEESAPVNTSATVDVATERILAGIALSEKPDRGDKAPMLGLTALRGGYIGMLMFGTLGSLAGVAVLTPFGGVVGVLLGRKALRDEKQRQLTLRRQQAKVAVRKYIDEVSFRVNNDALGTLRRLHRELRDQLAIRAEEVSTAAGLALEAAQHAFRVAEDDRSKRLARAEAEIRRLTALRRRATALVERGVESGIGVPG